MAEKTDYLLKCIDCGADFFTEGEKDFYLSKGLHMPKRCNPCRDKKKARYKEEESKAAFEKALAASPYKYIKKSNLPKNDPDTSLFIIGNGLDLMHGVKSSYYSFRDTLGKNNSLRFALETYLNVEDLWADFEDALAHINKMPCLVLLICGLTISMPIILMLRQQISLQLLIQLPDRHRQ